MHSSAETRSGTGPGFLLDLDTNLVRRGFGRLDSDQIGQGTGWGARGDWIHEVNEV